MFFVMLALNTLVKDLTKKKDQKPVVDCEKNSEGKHILTGGQQVGIIILVDGQ